MSNVDMTTLCYKTSVLTITKVFLQHEVSCHCHRVSRVTGWGGTVKPVFIMERAEGPGARRDGI